MYIHPHTCTHVHVHRPTYTRYLPYLVWVAGRKLPFHESVTKAKVSELVYKIVDTCQTAVQEASERESKGGGERDSVSSSSSGAGVGGVGGAGCKEEEEEDKDGDEDDGPKGRRTNGRNECRWVGVWAYGTDRIAPPHVCPYVYVLTCMSAHVCPSVYVLPCMSLRVCLHVYVCTCMYGHRDTYMQPYSDLSYLCLSACIYTCILVSVKGW